MLEIQISFCTTLFENQDWQVFLSQVKVCIYFKKCMYTTCYILPSKYTSLVPLEISWNFLKLNWYEDYSHKSNRIHSTKKWKRTWRSAINLFKISSPDDWYIYRTCFLSYVHQAMFKLHCWPGDMEHVVRDTIGLTVIDVKNKAVLIQTVWSCEYILDNRVVYVLCNKKNTFNLFCAESLGWKWKVEIMPSCM